MPILEYIDGVPGSLYLVDDIAGHHEENAIHAQGKLHDIILNPTPSNDVNDPLNWSRPRKFMAMFCVMLYTAIIAYACNTTYSGFSEITRTRGIPLATLAQGVGYLYGAFGWAGPIVNPIAFRFGHRPVYLFGLLVAVASSVWTHVPNNSQWIASRVIYGIFNAPVESLVETTLAQIYFTHERGYYIAVYSFCLYGGAFIGPITTGYLFDNKGFDSVMWLTAAVCAFGFVFMFFFFEETCYNRHLPAALESNVYATTKEGGSDIEDKTDANGIITNRPSVLNNSGRQLEGTPYGFVRRMRFSTKTFCTWRQMFDSMWRPFYIIFRFPSVFFAGFEYGCSLTAYTVMVSTVGVVINAPPYNFSSGATGLIYIAPFLAAIVGGTIIGKLGDKYAIRAARRNNGVREPEQRLVFFILSAILAPFAFILWGVGATHQVQWFGLVFALGLIGLYTTINAAANLTYALDCYRDLAGEVMISVVLVRNTISFAVGYGITPWLANLGIQNTYIMMGLITMGFMLCFIPMMIFGKRIRVATKDAYWRMVKTSAVAH